MPDIAVLEWLRSAFWLAYPVAMILAAGRAVRSRDISLGRSVFALLAGSIAQSVGEGMVDGGAGILPWWGHMAISLPVFILITMPPRAAWQPLLGGLVLAQMVLHGLWGLSPDIGRAHWLGCILIGFLKCAVLIGWAGGPRVEFAVGRMYRRAVDLVLAPARGNMARSRPR